MPMTPFELNLSNELDIERQRFINKWLFPWHNINIPSRVVDIEDFRGGRFHVGGIVFEGQIQELYWQATSRYLVGKVHDTFRRWKEETESYPAVKQQSSLDGAQKLLTQFVSAIIAQARETDRRLRGKGYPDKVLAYNASREHSHANAEIVRLASSYRSLMEDTPPASRGSLVQRVEAFGTTYRGTIAILALAAATLFGLWKILVG